MQGIKNWALSPLNNDEWYELSLIQGISLCTVTECNIYRYDNVDDATFHDYNDFK